MSQEIHVHLDGAIQFDITPPKGYMDGATVMELVRDEYSLPNNTVWRMFVGSEAGADPKQELDESSLIEAGTHVYVRTASSSS